MRAIALSTLAAACAPEYGFQAFDPAAAPGPVAPPASASRGVRPEGLATPAPSRPASEAPSTPKARPPRGPRPGAIAQEAPLGGGAATDTVDFLFVVDNSSSMKAIIDSVFDGFDALVAEGALPKDVRVAITSTLPADPEHRHRLHPAVRKASIVKHDPGFGALVDAAGIAAYRAVSPDMAEAFALDGCDAWFAPGAENAQGIPCLVAHTQNALLPVGVEAGLTAVQQLLAEEQVFRTGAAANIVFVSDTQDPGLGPDNPAYEVLAALRPTADAIVATARNRQVTASLRLHAIAPRTECGQESYAHIGDVYGDAARATGGRTLDICTAAPEDYVAMVRGIVEDGSVPTAPVIPLARPDRVGHVFLDGAPVGYHLSRDEKAVVLDAPMPSTRSTVRIEYRAVRPPAPPMARTPLPGVR